MMLIWVIGTPLLALSILIHQRNNLDSWEVKKYLLVIYQGLKPKAFYWEFVNTLRKLVILGINALLFSFEAEYRILFGMSTIYFFLRLQINIQPYKKETNNDIEMKGIIASAITLFSGVIFVTEEKAFTGFDVILLAIMFIFNCVFILTWLYLLL